MQKILIHYLAGARENQVDEFPVAVQQELIVGRDAAAHIRFDAERDDLVSRQHSKIIQSPWDPSGFQLVDLQSRNGTFLNHKRVYGSERLNHRDVIQLGAGGPEFRFELDPPPASALQTDQAAAFGVGAKATRESWMPEPQGAPRPIGRGTVERMLGDVFTRMKKDHKTSRWVVVSVLAAVIVLGGGVWFYLRQSQANLAASVAQAKQQSQQDLAHVNDELKKEPAALEEARLQVEKLEAELQKSNSRNDANVQKLLSELQAQRKQADDLERAFKQQKASQIPPAAPTPAGPASERTPVATATTPTQPQAPPTAAPAASISPVSNTQSLPAGTSFDSVAAKVRSMIDSGQVVEALGLATQLVQYDSSRWEGYSLAGEAAQKISDYSLAADMYRRAAPKAPADMRAHLEDQARKMQEKVGK
jgi:pSer/pThr/pTyr-binding forkhead associated (FHA) protein